MRRGTPTYTVTPWLYALALHRTLTATHALGLGRENGKGQGGAAEGGGSEDGKGGGSEDGKEARGGAGSDARSRILNGCCTRSRDFSRCIMD